VPRLGRYLVIVGVVVVVAVLAGAVVLGTFEHPTAPKGPPISLEVGFGQPTRTWGVHWQWYNFTITGVRGLITWNQTTVIVDNGSLWPITANSSLMLVNKTSGVAIAFTPSPSWAAGGRNWTTTYSAPVEVGSILSLEVYYSLTGGDIGIVWTGPPAGSYSYAPLP
jgi:hypothetical protein